MGNVTIYGPEELNSQVANYFLSCLNSTGTDYRLYVEDFGTTIALPPTNRTIDFEGEDQGLFECIVKVNLQMEVAAESTLYDQGESQTVRPSSLVTYEWLSEHGGLGKKPVGSRPPKTMGASFTADARSIIPRQSLVYWAYPASDTGCENSDLIASYAHHCHNSASAYKSIQFEISARHEYLKVEMWPHHQLSPAMSISYLVGDEVDHSIEIYLPCFPFVGSYRPTVDTYHVCRFGAF
ncbi:predicted protein [Aspergillus terreus NIH2624]|uniref:Uncharacterized protein n=1 Tax=Aspergillus terreus (strain NIH 2624 / FGSC A1156) TaxID=341663 RepID=Q0D063_ASPTN|nr:uncharacterized protein ATEG_00671 [Aspergillus terreus NIH2624]EAU39317.1 predicted protein [Aspergillus terreus NIH2624]